MDQVSYNRLGRRRRRTTRGFRFSSLRLSVLRLRVKFFSFLSLFTDCMEEVKCGQPRGGATARSPCRRTSSRRALVSRAQRDESRRGGSRRLSSSAAERESSYYAEAIADCLEFIKRSSLPNHDCAVNEGRERGLFSDHGTQIH
uniref:Uncharacterized protein n=1 Tax=Ananas comosus var. bracteatus TaxID=296719 RepID=A0A6V7PK78_ANACO|nr:unnamed protein product [Ananas comosus var. bracteatus]